MPAMNHEPASDFFDALAGYGAVRASRASASSASSTISRVPA